MLCQRCNKKETRKESICSECRKTLDRQKQDNIHIDEDGYKYDKFRRMIYTPEFHFNQGKPWTEDELQYLCMFADYDETRTISFAIGRTETVINAKISSLRKTKMVDVYHKRYMDRMKEGSAIEIDSNGLQEG